MGTAVGVAVKGVLRYTTRGADGTILDQSTSHNLITTSGLNLLTSAINWSCIQNQGLGFTSVNLGNLYGAVGTSTTPVQATDTTLGLEVARSVVASAKVTGTTISYTFTYTTGQANLTVSEAGIFAQAALAAPALSATGGLTSGSDYSSLSITSCPADIPSGSTVTLGYGTTTTQTLTTTSDTPVNATTMSVVSFTANATYAAGSTVAYTPGVLLDHAILPASIAKTSASTATLELDLTLPATAMTPLTAYGQQQLAAERAAVLQPWFAALAGRDYQRCNIVVIGDSISEGQGATQFDRRWIGRLRDMLRTRFPTVGLTGGGRGYIGMLSSGEVSYTWPVTITGTAANPNTDFGPKREMGGIYSGTSVAFSLVGDSADIMWAQSPFGVAFKWQVDGGTQTTVNTNGSTLDGQITHVSLGTAGAHTLGLVGTDTSFQAYIDGVIEYNGDYTSGIQVHDCAHWGWNSGTWINDSGPVNEWPASIAALKPNLIIIMLGANDLFAGTTPATFQGNLALLMSYMRAAMTAPYPPIVLAFLAPRSGTYTYPWSSYINAAYALAATDGQCVVFDMTLGPRMPAVAATYTYGLWADSVHPSDAGHSLIGDYLCSYLSPE